ncbi:MAG: ThiF family adenylyltransferase [Tepidisphaeraceae bacterium]
MPIDRYHRQSLLPAIGPAGQARIRSASVLVVGVGALGSVVAEQLARAGVGRLTLVDRDVVEWTNLQRQVLYEEADAKRSLPKVEAAAKRLHAINSDVAVDSCPIDLDASNLPSLIDDVKPTVIVDGTDNAATRYLLNDLSIDRGIPWVMGGSIGMEGRVMPVLPGRGPCLRCVYPTPPSPGELATCDTAGVLGPIVTIVGAQQAALALRMLVGDAASIVPSLLVIDSWDGRFHSIDLVEAKRTDCPCCGARNFEFLNGQLAPAGAKLCGRNAVQVRAASGAKRVDLRQLRERLKSVADLDASDLMLKAVLHDRPELALTIFADGRMIVFGSEDPVLARSIYSRVVGN